MARRKRVDLPSDDDLKALEAGFEAKPVVGVRPPIAQVAGEAAALSQPVAPTDRADAERFRRAESEGRIIDDIPLTQIDADELTRDRAALDAEAMEELKASIAAYGVRTPVEVFRLESGRFGLLSGYRRLKAVQDISGENAVIRAIVRDVLRVSDAYVTMVEENEVRSNLSHYERGRIAVLAARQGAYVDTSAAVAALFASGSKAKRSKIRSFAAIHEELGDVLHFPTALGERLGLRISNALKAGHGEALRRVLVEFAVKDANEEARVLVEALGNLVAKPDLQVSRAKPAGQTVGESLILPNGITLSREKDRRGYSIRLNGTLVDEELVQTVFETVHASLNQN